MSNDRISVINNTHPSICRTQQCTINIKKTKESSLRRNSWIRERLFHDRVSVVRCVPKTTGVDMSVCVLILYTTVVFTVSSSTLLTCRRNKLHRHITKQNKTKTCLYGGQLVSLDFLRYWFYIKRDLCLRRFWTQQWFPRQGNE